MTAMTESREEVSRLSSRCATSLTIVSCRRRTGPSRSLIPAARSFLGVATIQYFIRDILDTVLRAHTATSQLSESLLLSSNLGVSRLEARDEVVDVVASLGDRSAHVAKADVLQGEWDEISETDRRPADREKEGSPSP